VGNHVVVAPRDMARMTALICLSASSFGDWQGLMIECNIHGGVQEVYCILMLFMKAMIVCLDNNGSMWAAHTAPLVSAAYFTFGIYWTLVCSARSGLHNVEHDL
jgi:hypothetical protein